MRTTFLLVVQNVVHRTELQMMITTEWGESTNDLLAGAEGVGAWKGGTQRRVVDLSGTQNSVHEND